MSGYLAMACPHDGILRGQEQERSPDTCCVVDEPGDRMLRERARHEDPLWHGHVCRKGAEQVNPAGTELRAGRGEEDGGDHLMGWGLSWESKCFGTRLA